METLPLISVIVPVYKVEKYLDRCIESIVRQTYRNLEILLVDDGSPDGSGAICDRWAAKDDRIRVIHKENGGAGKARNVALDLACGEFIGMVDSDDYIEPHMYTHLYGMMGENIDITECTGRATEGNTCPLDNGTEGTQVEMSAEEAMRCHIREEMFTQVIWNKLYRRSIIGDIRFPEGNLIDDEFFTYRVIGNARRLVHSSSVMYAYRQQADSVMHKPYSLKRLQGVEARKARLAYLKEKMPSLAYEGQVNLFFFCIHAMQMSILWLKGEELEQARTFLHTAVAEITPLRPDWRNSLKDNIWLMMAQISFEGVCKLQNYLEAREK